MFSTWAQFVYAKVKCGDAVHVHCISLPCRCTGHETRPTLNLNTPQAKGLHMTVFAELTERKTLGRSISIRVSLSIIMRTKKQFGASNVKGMLKCFEIGPSSNISWPVDELRKRTKSHQLTSFQSGCSKSQLYVPTPTFWRFNSLKCSMMPMTRTWIKLE